MMTAQEFVRALQIRIGEGSIQAIRENLERPPGRKPSPILVEDSEWFRALEINDRSKVLRLVARGVDSALFGFLCVLDGVASIEDGPVKGVLKLFYSKGNENTLLNNPNDELLHDVYRLLAPPK
jgi:hypothetical protein